MNVTLLGATGRTGQPLLSILLADGHRVRALVRDPSGLAAAPGLEILAGSSTDRDALDSALEGSEAVLSTLGPTKDQPDLHSRTARLLIEAMTAQQMARFIGVSAAGIDVPGDRKGARDRIISSLIRRFGGAIAADKSVEYALFAASSLDWTLVRPPRLISGSPTGRFGHDAHRPGRSSIRRGDLATAVATILDDRLYVRQAPFVWGA